MLRLALPLALGLSGLPAQAAQAAPPSADTPPDAPPTETAADAAQIETGAGTTQTGAVDAPALPAQTTAETATPQPTRNGADIYRAFRDGLAEPGCGNADPRWLRHFSHAPDRLANPDSDALALFGHVVDALREEHLPTEFALIPFIESGYAPGARSRSGPAGLWQFVAITARHHGITVGSSYDGRLSPAESTRAAVRYLKTLNGMFAGNWRLAIMAYNAGEHRMLQALRRSGNGAQEAVPTTLTGLSPTTYAYVEKMHALACLLEDAGAQPQWQAAVDRPVPNLVAVPLERVRSLDQWTATRATDTALLRRINPALAGRWPAKGSPLALVQVGDNANAPAAIDSTTMADATAATDASARTPRTHTVQRGDSAWAIARRHGLSIPRLLELNGLGAKSILRPGMVLRLE